PRHTGQIKVAGRNARTTGASAGIGREFARQRAGRARSMILIARREEQLVELNHELQQQHENLRVHIRKADLSDLAQLKELMESLDREQVEIDLLVNNAGLGDSGLFATSEPTGNEQMLLVNVVALTSLTRHLPPHMIAKRHGRYLAGRPS